MYKNQAWYFRAQQTSSEGGEQVIRFLHPPFLYFPRRLAFLGGLRVKSWRAPSRAPRISLPASGHAPSQNTNDVGWHIWESKQGAPKQASRLQMGTSLPAGTNSVYFNKSNWIHTINTLPRSPLSCCAAGSWWVYYRQCWRCVACPCRFATPQFARTLNVWFTQNLPGKNIPFSSQAS